MRTQSRAASAERHASGFSKRLARCDLAGAALLNLERFLDGLIFGPRRTFSRELRNLRVAQLLVQRGHELVVATSGKELVLHSFAGPPDGGGPNGGLLNVSGILYGTTFSGGDAPCGMTNAEGCGVVFDITTAGKETVLYGFGGTPDAACPNAGLLNESGTLYGTTHYGGTHGYGTVYSVTTAGTEAVIHSFGRRASGPSRGGLLDVKDSLYGATSGGDGHDGYGYGTLFTLKP